MTRGSRRRCAARATSGSPASRVKYRLGKRRTTTAASSSLASSPGVGNVQGVGKCAYVRSGGNVFVIDVSDPAKPVEVMSVPVQSGSETMRAVVTDKRAVLVSGSSVYDISNCLKPVLAGEIKWPPLRLPGIAVRLVPHDIRVNRAGTKVYASFGVWEADITNLKDPSTWTVTDHRCELAAQQPGPWIGSASAVNQGRSQSVCRCDSP